MSTLFTIVTPCRNAAAYIGDTVESVLTQTALRSGRARLRYVIVDGASSDNTVEVVRHVGGASVVVVSEPDSGMYDALAKGLSCSPETDGVTAYINAGDMFYRTAFDVVLDVLADESISWVKGYDAYYNRAGHPIAFRLPFRYKQGLLRRGVYGTRLPAVQQESTFWRSQLNESLDLDVLRSYKLAGDYYLWKTFSESHDLYVVASFLGGFRYHGGHLSDDMRSYRDELLTIADPPAAIDRLRVMLEWVGWRVPDRLKASWSGGRLLRYDRNRERWR